MIKNGILETYDNTRNRLVDAIIEDLATLSEYDDTISKEDVNNFKKLSISMEDKNLLDFAIAMQKRILIHEKENFNNNIDNTEKIR